MVKLKRPARPVSVYDLGKQIQKYPTGVLKIFEYTGTPHEPVEVVCLLGTPPIEWDDADGKRTVEESVGST